MKTVYWILSIILVSLLLASLSFAEDGEPYQIKPGDILNIYVHENQDLTLSAPVLPDGTISYPLVGNLYVQGMTTAGLQAALTEKLKGYLQNPVVVVSISSQTSYEIFVQGEVRKAGAYAFNQEYRLTDYLALAGGTGDKANLKKCYVFSKGDSTNHKVINLEEIFADNKQELNITLKPDDTILVSRRSGFSITQWVEVAQLFSVLVSTATLYIVINRNR